MTMMTAKPGETPLPVAFGVKGVAAPAAPSSPISNKNSDTNPNDLSADNYKFLQQEIYRDSGIVLDEDKRYLLESRLGQVLRAANLATLNDLCTRLRSRLHPALGKQVMEALTTNETLFFRDQAPFEALKTKLLPEILERLRPNQPLNIWSAAASSGQEAYSIAMLLEERGMKGRPVHILGTDISEQILVTAREAKYVQFEVNRGLPALYLVKYFKRDGLDWRVKDDIREKIKFKQFDLRQPMTALGRFQVIFCRNVLIYFDLETKTNILKQLHTVLEPGGFLILGGAEQIMNLSDRFERIPESTTSIFRRKP